MVWPLSVAPSLRRDETAQENRVVGRDDLNFKFVHYFFLKGDKDHK